MAGYPPPYPPPPDYKGQDYKGQDYKGQDYKGQRRAMKMQVRMQRDQTRLQARAMRRGSIAGPILLVTLGVIFLLVETGRLSWYPVLAWYGRWWPVLLIGAGCILAAEWALDQHAQANGTAPSRGARTLGGGAVWLLILLAVSGGLSHLAGETMFWDNNHFRFNLADMDKALGDPHDSDTEIRQAVAGDGTVTLDNPRGDVTVSGTSDDGQMHIAVHKQVYAFNDGDADGKADRIQPIVKNDGGHVTVTVPQAEGAHADLTVELPRTVALTISADRGDVRVSGMHAAVVVNGNRGSVDLSGLDGSATTHLHSSGATFSAHSITGPVLLDGRSGDVNVSDVHGAVGLTGDFFGTTHLERVNGSVRFHSSRTDFQMARLDGEMDLDTGSDLRADQVLGPVVLMTRQRNITLERVQGDVKVGNRDGSVTLTSATPLGAIEITNRHGSVDIGVPANAGFVVHAATRHGSVENDFSLAKSGSDDQPEMNGTVGRGGPQMRVQTSDGDVTVRQSTVPPLPLTPPAPPQLTAEPAAPAPPAAPKAPATPHSSKTPARPETQKAPKMPAAPKAPPAGSGDAWMGTLSGDSLG